MENNTEATQLITSSIFQNLKDNWINIVIILAVLLILIVIVRFISKRIRKLFDKKISDEKIEIKKRTFTFTSVVSNLIIVASVLIAILIIASELGIRITPILAGAGVMSVIIGFGAQSFIKDLINGTFILFEQWFQVNDVITVGDTSGTVERFNLRTTVIRDIEGTVHYIPGLVVLG